MTTELTASPAQRRAALEAEFAPWVPRTLDQQFDHTVERFPDRPYVIAGDLVLTYREVQRWARRLADGLAAIGVRPGDHVGLIMANFPEYTPLKMAIARVGGVAVPLNYLYRTDELGYVLAQSNCRVLITMTGFRDMDYLAMLDELAPGWDRTGVPVIGELSRVVMFDPAGAGTGRDGVLDLSDVERIGEEHTGLAPGGLRDPGDPSDILYTSGTTGSPKGVLLTHDALQRTSYGSAYCRALPDGNRVVFALPCYHLFAYEHAIQASLFVGGAILPQPKFEPLEYFAAIEKHRVTDLLGVPTMSVALVQHPERDRFDLSSLQRMLSGSAVAPSWLWERIEEALGVTELTTAYGMTEIGASVMTQPEDPVSVLTRTVGRPKPSGAAGIPEFGGVLAQYRVLDPATGDEVPAGQEGELVSRGPSTMLGYWNRPEDTDAVLRAGWLHSGDVGRFLPDGSLVITGRAKDLYKSGGELVMPKEVEDLLTRQPGVSQAYVVGVPDELWGESGCAFVIPDPGATPDPEELIAACRAGLARFKVPRHVFITGAQDIPQTSTGKVQKFRLVPIAQRLIGPEQARTTVAELSFHERG
ncbi:AMP-binding protein [Nocardia neocaledoniensis NBRC 108232]|uniref:Fatty-acyl-CoA synthase n=1 Tax=Nocardia neocaledoniensis TaxID=236511 RepID=A0A317N0W5_9NOCA|nr:AMP-binding protein [Nocardia neocaledoniensis]PWV67561.1 fatty-acyl-CoA synthase [Nocardia neocaledoniensis]GEM31259.1 AMP-binding protein [Nocardia neocaledoniensis NBRC 108232]